MELNLPEGVYVDYVISVVIVTYLLLKYILKSDVSESYRIKTNIIVGIAIGVGFHLLKGYDIKSLAISLATTTSVYQWVVQAILNKVGLEYKATDPQVVK